MDAASGIAGTLLLSDEMTVEVVVAASWNCLMITGRLCQGATCRRMTIGDEV